VRQKDADTVARVLGNEMRLASNLETEGLLSAVGAVAGHMSQVHTQEFDPVRFWNAFNEAKDHGWGTPSSNSN
jgi:hypothetical protein